MTTYDIIVIGMGAGYHVLDTALESGARCAVAERAHYGGTCLNFGCIPTKVLITAANVCADHARNVSIGVIGSAPRLDLATLHRRVCEKRADGDAIRAEYAAEPALTMYEDVCFIGPKHLAPRRPDGTLGEPMTADIIVIAAGAHTRPVALPGLTPDDVWTPERFFGDAFPQTAPARLAIIGGGAIGSEMAHFFAAAQSQVTLFQRNVRLAPKLDADLSEALHAGLTEAGVTIKTNVNVCQAERRGDGAFRLTYEDKTTTQRSHVDVDAVFWAPGIVSNAADLGVATSAIETDARGFIRTNEYLETTCPGVYALGDINGRLPFRHKANLEAETLSYNLFQRPSHAPRRAVRYATVPSAIFSRPEVASLGLTEEEVKAQGRPYRVGRMPLADVAKGYALGLQDRPNDGFVKLITSAEGTVLGVHIAGPEAALLLQPYAVLAAVGRHTVPVLEPAIASEATAHERATRGPIVIDPHTVDALDRSVVIHPALSEAAMWVTTTLTDVTPDASPDEASITR